MKKRPLIFVLAMLMAVMTLSFLSCSKKDDGKQNPPRPAASGKAAREAALASAKAGLHITTDSTTIYGEKITNDIYKENDLTLINIMATWCGPCIQEIPDLAAIDAEDNGFGVVGFVLDTYDERSGSVNKEAVEAAKKIAEAKGVKYPMVIPTEEFLDQTVRKMAAVVPMSFIVDQNGVVVKGPIAGAKDKSTWLYILESARSAL